MPHQATNNVRILPGTVRAPVFDRHQFFGTSEYYGKAHGSLLSGWMNYNYTACCWFPTSSNILILPSQFWQSSLKVADCTVQSAEYWCFYGTHLYTWVESSNVDKLSCWRTNVPGIDVKMNPQPFDPESKVQSNIPRHFHMRWWKTKAYWCRQYLFSLPCLCSPPQVGWKSRLRRRRSTAAGCGRYGHKGGARLDLQGWGRAGHCCTTGAPVAQRCNMKMLIIKVDEEKWKVQMNGNISFIYDRFSRPFSSPLHSISSIFNSISSGEAYCVQI